MRSVRGDPLPKARRALRSSGHTVIDDNYSVSQSTAVSIIFPRSPSCACLFFFSFLRPTANHSQAFPKGTRQELRSGGKSNVLATYKAANLTTCRGSCCYSWSSNWVQSLVSVLLCLRGA